MHRDSAEVFPAHVALADVQARAHFDPKGCEDSVTGALHGSPPEALQCMADELVVSIEQFAPPAITEPSRYLGGPDDVREQDSCEHTVHLDRVMFTGQPLQDHLWVRERTEVNATSGLLELGIRYPIGDEPPV